MIGNNVCEEGKKLGIWGYVCVIHEQRMCASKRTWKNTYV
jgi:hypothetical protein